MLPDELFDLVSGCLFVGVDELVVEVVGQAKGKRLQLFAARHFEINALILFRAI